MDFCKMFTVYGFQKGEWYASEERSLKTRKGAINAARKMADGCDFVKVVEERLYDCGMEMSRVVWRSAEVAA